jgi:hypothetical protein
MMYSQKAYEAQFIVCLAFPSASSTSRSYRFLFSKQMLSILSVTIYRSCSRTARFYEQQAFRKTHAQASSIRDLQCKLVRCYAWCLGEAIPQSPKLLHDL